MNISTNYNTSCLINSPPWYESADGACIIQEPTLINMGDDQPLHLLFPVYWREWLFILPKANRLASELNALLILMPYGDLSLEQMKQLVLEFAHKSILPLWVGEENRSKFNCAVALLNNAANQLINTYEQYN